MGTTNMKFLVLFACVVAAASAQLMGYPNGAVAPAKTPEVQAAEAAHFAAHGIAAPVAYAAAYPYAHHGFVGLVGHANGAVVPVEPAEVVAARAAHLAHFA